MLEKKRGLGRGLSELGVNELLGDLRSTPAVHSDFQVLPIDQLNPGRYQPRRQISAECLEELANSIRSQGLIQPIVVRKIGSNFEIIAGERRWRACKLIGLTEIPVVIKNISDETAMAMALIENIQRKDLNAIEEAFALQRLLTEFGMTHEQVANSIGKARSSVTNSLRLLKLNDHARELLEKGAIEMGHARALLSLNEESQNKVVDQILNQALSVRDTELLIRKLEDSSSFLETSNSNKKSLDPHLKQLQKKLTAHLALRVRIKPSSEKSGQLVLHYKNATDLENILNYFNVKDVYV